MKLRTQIIGFGVAGIVFAGVAGGIGWFAAGRLGGSIGQAIQAGQSLRLSLVADMMHDAIRADDQRAMLGAIEKQPEQIAEAEKDLAEHTRKFDAALVELQTLTLSTKSQHALDAARTLAAAYFAAARQVVVDAQRDLKAMQRSAAAMQDSFSKLETAMETLSESIEQHSEAITADALASVDRIRWSILGALAVTLAAMLGFALWFANRLARPMADAVHVADRLADGDLTVHIEPSGNDDTRALLASMARMHHSFESIVAQVKANAEQVASASTQIATGNADLSARTERQAAALEQTAATTDQIGSTVRSNADNARTASELAASASKVASDGGGVMSQVVDTMNGISKSSQEISGIIGVIDSIAFQTNILALNAAVEAARAGEQGRGFAVVASEVRGLAQRSAQAAHEVRALVAASVSRVERGAELVGQAGQTMEQIVGSTRRVAEIVSAISAASLEQSDGVAQMGQAVQQIDQVTQQNAALVEQSAAAAESLSHQAHQLVTAVARFRLAGNADRGAAPVLADAATTLA